MNRASALLLDCLMCLAVSAWAGDEDSHAREHSTIGRPGESGNITRTVGVEMRDDMRFRPGKIVVKKGETIRFAVKNTGKLRHEFVLGTEHELKEHYEIMKKFPEMEHADADAITVPPGGSGEVIWQFTRSGTVDFACLEPGHYEAGMKGQVLVKERQAGR